MALTPQTAMGGSRPSPRPPALSLPSAAFHSRLRSWTQAGAWHSPSRAQERALIFTRGPCYICFSRRPISPARRTRAGGRKGNSQSERDWARSLLRKGVNEETLARQLEAAHQDKPKPAYTTQRTVARATASLREEQLTPPFNQPQGDRHHD